MADTRGSAYELDVSTDGVSYTSVGGIKDAGLSFGRDKIDVNDFDQPNFHQALSDRVMATLSATMNYDESDAGQAIIMTNNGSTLPAALYWKVRPKGDDVGTSKEYIFQADITSLDVPNADGSPVEMSLTAESTGAITYQTQA